MSQPENWKVEMKKLMKETLKEMEVEKPSQSPPSSEPKHEHKHFNFGDEICPECYPKVAKAVIQKEFKDTDAICDSCGLPTHLEEAKKDEWECKSCGGRYAKPK